MSEDRPIIPRAFMVLVSAACLVVVVAGLKAASEIILPVVFSVFIAVLVWPMVSWMTRHHIHRGAAIIFAMLIVAALMVVGTAAVTDSVAEFTASVPKYRAPLEADLARAHEWLSARGLGRMAELESMFNPDSLMRAVSMTAAAIVGVLSKVVIVVVTTAIVLLEATELGRKIEVAFEHGGSWVSAAGERVQRYLALKTVISLATGILMGAWTAAWGLEFAVLWGIVAFVFNFIPAFGSIISSIPPIALALVELGPGSALGLGLGYLLVHVALGNFLEPRIMGRRLGLSPFVVVVSLFFWGYVWGAAGMLVAVPLTVICKLLLESSPSTRWLAVLLGGAEDAESMPGPIE